MITAVIIIGYLVIGGLGVFAGWVCGYATAVRTLYGRKP